MAKILGKLTPRAALTFSTPGLLGAQLMQSEGYLFARVDDSQKTGLVIIYNGREPVGKISYEIQGNDVIATIEDIPNSHGDILTTAIRNAGFMF